MRHDEAPAVLTGLTVLNDSSSDHLTIAYVIAIVSIINTNMVSYCKIPYQLQVQSHHDRFLIPLQTKNKPTEVPV